TAKTKAATSPAIGAVRSSSSRRAPRRATATPAAATAPAETDTAAVKKPSGTCTTGLPECVRQAHSRTLLCSCKYFALANDSSQERPRRQPPHDRAQPSPVRGRVRARDARPGAQQPAARPGHRVVADLDPEPGGRPAQVELQVRVPHPGPEPPQRRPGHEPAPGQRDHPVGPLAA